MSDAPPDPGHRWRRGLWIVFGVSLPATSLLFTGNFFVLGIAAALLVAITSHALVWSYRAHEQRLRNHNVRHYCRGCGYSMLGVNPGKACPECGRRFDPSEVDAVGSQ